MSESSSEHAGGTTAAIGTAKRLALIVVLLGALAMVTVLAYEYGYFQASPTPLEGPSLMRATCSSISTGNGTAPEHVASGGAGDHAYFLIVEADYQSPYGGMNGSAYAPVTEQWPTMNVKLGQVVSIHVINCAPSEPHGFQISYYDGPHPYFITVPAGHSYDVTFTATKLGTFRVYCGIFCSIHLLMQNGALVVSSQ